MPKLDQINAATRAKLRTSALAPSWTPAALNPAVWFDFHDGALITSSPASSIFTDPGSIAPKAGAGVTGNTNLSHILHANPYFGGARTLCLRGGASRFKFNGAESLFKNCAGITMAMLYRPTVLQTGTQGPTTQPVYGFIGTAVAGQVRQQIAGSATVVDDVRVGGRQTDGVAASLATVTGNMGNTAILVITRTNAATSLRDTWVNEVARETAVATGQASGVFSNTNSTWVGVGSFDDAQTDMPSMELQQVVFDNKPWSDTDCRKFAGWALNSCSLQRLLPLDHPYRYTFPEE